MAFCTKCGATLQGAFCSQCGTPARAASGQASAVPVSAAPQAAPAAPPMPPPAPGAGPRRKTSPIVWVLVAVLGLFILCVAGLVGAGIIVAHNPGMVLSKVIHAANPDLDVLSTDVGARTLRIRDRRTGKEVTVSFDDARAGRFRLDALGDDGQAASVEIGAGGGKLPLWVPAYPGAEAKGTFAVKADDGNRAGAGGSFAFTTRDAPAKVKAFYEDKCREAGMQIHSTISGELGSMITASDEGERHTLHITVVRGNDETTVNVIYAAKR